MSKDIVQNPETDASNTIGFEHLGRFNDKELETLRKSKAVEAIRTTQDEIGKHSLGWIILALIGTIPASIQTIREAKSVKNYFFGEANTIKELFSWQNTIKEIKKNFPKFYKGKWNIAGTIAMAVGFVMYAITNSREKVLDGAADIIAKNTVLVPHDDDKKQDQILQIDEPEHGEKWQALHSKEKQQATALTKYK